MATWHKLGWFIGCWLISLGSLDQCGLAQETAEVNPTSLAGNMDSIVEKTLGLISRKAGKFDLEETAALLELRLEHMTILSRHLRGLIEESADSIRKLMAQLDELENTALTEGSSLIPSSDTLEMLTRNCLIELQKLQWEVAAEESSIDAEINAQQSALKIQRIRLESQKLALEGLQEKLSAAKQDFERVRVLMANGTESITKGRQAEAAVVELQNQLKIALKNYEATEAEVALQQDASLVKNAMRKKSNIERQKLLDRQLEQLAHQKKQSAKVAIIVEKIAQEKKLQFERTQMSIRLAIESKSLEYLHSMLERAIKKSEEQKAEQPKNESK